MNRRKKKNENNRLILIFGLIFCISISFADILLSIFYKPPAFESFFIMLLPLTISIAVFLLLFVFLYVFSKILKIVLHLKTLNVLFHSFFLITVSFLCARLLKLIQYPLPEFNLKMILFFIIIIFSYGIFFIFTRKMSFTEITEKYFNKPLLPFILFVILLSGWFLFYPLSHFHGLIRILISILSVGFFYFISRFLYSVLKRVDTVKLLTGFICLLLFINPFVYFVLGKKSQLKEHDFVKSEDHIIKHVFLLTVDALRLDCVSCYGFDKVQTPNIDRLAEDGIIFKNGFSASPWTLPSFASIMTGLPTSIHTTTRVVSILPDTLTTLAEVMKDNNYLTAAIGHNTFLSPKHKISQGFQEYNFTPKPFHMIGYSFGAKILGKMFLKPYYSTTELTNMAMEWFNKNHSNDFFFWLHYFDPHIPYSPPDEYLPDKILCPSIGKAFSDMKGIRHGKPTESEKKWIELLYKKEILYVDANIGRLLDRLEKLGLYDESLIIFTSDHGEEFWEHGGFEHGHTLYNELINVPLIIKMPKTNSESKKKMIYEMVSTQAIPSTIFDLCKINTDRDSLASPSLAPLWQPQRDFISKWPVYSSALLYNMDSEAVIFKGKKYIRCLVTGESELYDLHNDPEEQKSILELQPDYVDTVEKVLNDFLRESMRIRRKCDLMNVDIAKMSKDTKNRLRALGYLK